MRSIIDLSPLRVSRSFRLFWAGTSAQSLARQMTNVAVLFQIWDMTGDAFWVGVLALVTAVPMIVLGMIGGWLADNFDRRVVISVTTLGAVIASLVLVLQAFLELNSIALLLAIVFVQTCFTSAGGPARRSVLPRILPDRVLSAGYALTQLSFQVAMLLGPVLGGVLIATFGLGVTYGVEVVGFTLALLGIWSLPSIPPEISVRKFNLQSVFAGIAEVRKRPVLLGSFLIDAFATILVMPIAVLPLLNAERFLNSPDMLGVLLSSIALGGVVAGAFSGLYSRVRRMGILQIVSAVVWIACLGALALPVGLAGTVALLALAGAADMVAVVTRGTMIQLSTPDELRGRVSAVEQVVGVAGPELGNFRGGVSASLLGLGPSIIGGALAALAVVACTYFAIPAVRDYKLESDSV
ncbi:MFS transporter [Pseudoclavibacter sp. AY1F1]|uniref:MFS transporter n=1 Tax=Pseudoclavibacter sp. AY1F1 TaxID=2080583 RepID=UPI000CE7F3B1|nr:MFS transporter [Pseudoclavibacter sp. AY1F1]PPF44848.1 MFS transporter [Pseudoclavibacter sp. AY1F1]